MFNRNKHPLARYAALATLVIAAGLIISLQPGGTWWLLLMAALAWVQVWLLRREILTSGLVRRLFNAVSWALLGFAGASLLPGSARIIGDLVVLLIVLASFVGMGMRRAR